MLKRYVLSTRQCLSRPTSIPIQQSRSFQVSSATKADFSHVVIGGGIVGTAIGAELQSIEGNNVLIAEKNEHLGMETTSRNSEVIHAGIYYPKDSLKGQLCIKGKQKIYEAFEKGDFQVPLQKCGKWVVAQNDSEKEYLDKMYNFAKDLDVPVSFVPTSLGNEKLPLIRAESAILESPTTGIISAHDYTTFFLTQFELHEGTLGLKTELVDVQYDSSTPCYRLNFKESDTGNVFEITTDNLINSAGLHAQKIANMVLPSDRHFKSYFSKGTYFSYSPIDLIKTSSITDKLIYPCPNPNASSLGTHLTFDLGGQLRFGPDAQWLDIESADAIDYAANDKNLTKAYEAVSSYFPKIKLEELSASYSGVRPKLYSKEDSTKKFSDFYIKEEEGFKGFVNLIGIESPGLTSSWAIADYVKNIYHGLHD